MTNEQINRYKRHLILPEIGMEGQKKLLAAKVLCIGAGGLGCPISLYLAAAGVGTIGLADIDVVSPSNLQRQILFGTAQIGQDKVAVAAARLSDLNPDVKVVQHKTIVNSANVMELIRQYDIVVDGTDNFPTRYCVGDACVLSGKPNVYGSIFRFDGMVTVFAPHLPHPDRPGEHGPCYRCMYPEPPDPGSVPSCAEGGVMGVLPGIIGTLQAAEVLKLITRVGRPAIGKLLTYDALSFEVRTLKLRADPSCPVCGRNRTITAPIDYEQFCGVPIIDPQSLLETRREAHAAKPKPAAAAKPDPVLSVNTDRPKEEFDARGLPQGYPWQEDWEVTPGDVKAKLDSGHKFVFIDCRLPHEAQITKIDGAQLIPLQQINQHLDALRDHEDEEIIVHCKMGGRSLQFADILRKQGFTNVRSMAGGILLWNKTINPGGPQY
jgi:adenylyltransferase/sulfurtransferase